MANEEQSTDSASRFLIVRPENGRLVDVFRFLLSKDGGVFSAGFLECSSGEVRSISRDHRWIIFVSVIVRRILAYVGKPMGLIGLLVEFLLNFLSQNGGILGLITNVTKGRVVIPQRNSATFISAIGHLDPRVNLYRGELLKSLAEEKGDYLTSILQIGSKAVMDLCVLASKLSYENKNVVQNIVTNIWKMNFVEFYNCWDEFQKERSTQVFILTDRPKDANLILISFRGTEPFDADDWSTDFDYSWYEIPPLGKVHMGFLEALGLGNRAQPSTFLSHLQSKGYPPKDISSNGVEGTSYPIEDNEHPFRSSIEFEEDVLHDEDKVTAYYALRSKIKSLLREHKEARFIVTGHSLGGALAILFPAILLLHEEEEVMERLLGVYTFGQPRVGDMQLGKFMEGYLNQPVQRYFRVVYCNDLVPRLPYDDQTFLYKHFGVCLYYNSCYVAKCVDEEPNKNYFGFRYLIPSYMNAAWELIRSLIMGYIEGPEFKESWFSILFRVFGLAFPGFPAHAPTDYVNSVRLGRERLTMSSI